MSTPACQLYLVMPSTTPAAVAKLAAALSGGPIACLLLTPGYEDTFEPAQARPLIKLAQSKGVAVLVADDVVNARLLGADGVHLKDNPFAYDEARRTLGPKAIVGVEVGLSRHDAMELGERGADYVAFSESDFDPDLDAATPAAAKITDLEDDGELLDEVGLPLAERVAWWAEVFTVPCVAWDVHMPEEAQNLAAAGADFIALAPEAWLDAANPDQVIAAFAEAVAQSRPAA